MTGVGSRVAGVAEALRGLELVAARPLIRSGLLLRFALRPGDRLLVSAGGVVVAGAPLAERLRDRVAASVAIPAADPSRGQAAPEHPSAGRTTSPRPGDWWTGAPGSSGRGLRRRAEVPRGELLYEFGGHWRLAGGEQTDRLEAPVGGIVREARPGIGILLEVGCHALLGAGAVGGPARGTLAIVVDRTGELHQTGLDVGRAGTIVVAGARVDAEALTRARAMGIRGAVTGSLGGKEQRDFAASEARQRAAIGRLAPFGVLVLDGAVRRPIASPVIAALAALSGREVAIVADPPALLFEDRRDIPEPPPGWVRVRHGPLAGREGRWLGHAGRRRFAGGTHAEAGFIDLDDGGQVTVPLADLERFV